MILTDTHTHLYLPEFDDDRPNVIQRAFDADVKRIFLPNIDSDSIPALLALSAQYPQNCFPMLGLHPCSVKEDYKQELALVEKAISKNTIVAMGEIGMDLYWDQSFLKEQVAAFKIQIQWAKQADLPIVIHCRNAFDEIMQVLREEADDMLKGVFHCFSGTVEQAKQVLDLGFFLGIGGVVTFKNAGLDKVMPSIDISRVVLETDSPYLSPAPFRGKTNESAYLVHIAQKLAGIYQISLEEIAAITTENSKQLFKL